VAEVEGPRGAELERIARAGNVLDVQLSAAADDAFASFSNRASASADISISAKKAPSRMSATLIASISPARFSGAGSGARKSLSLITANGGAKVPRKFFFPNALMPFFTPTPPSAWLRLVVGRRMSRTPRCAVAAAKPIDAVPLDLGVELLDEIAAVLHRLASGCDERRADERRGARFAREIARDVIE
jgi:hypothetical protein